MPLLALALDWATEAGMPKELVLRRLCEWAVAGAFPEGAFITATGASVKPFDIYMSFRAAADTGGVLNPGIHLDRVTHYNSNDQWGIHVLSEVLVTAQDILAFCERTNTLAPPSLLRGFRRVWARRDQRKHLAPPVCPDAEEHAARQYAHDTATAVMNSLRSMLDRLRERPSRFGFRQIPGGPVDFDYWGAEWKKNHGYAQDEITRCQDAGLQPELDSLSAEWVAFVAEESRAATARANEAAEARQIQQKSDMRVECTPEEGKRRGRPRGSGSYKPADAPLVEQMRKLMLDNPSLSPSAAATRLAEQAAGGGTLDSKAKRLAERYLEKYGDSPR
jgi:hypothetical protein